MAESSSGYFYCAFKCLSVGVKLKVTTRDRVGVLWGKVCYVGLSAIIASERIPIMEA